MAGSVNKVILVGNVGKDPEVRTTQSGGKIVNLNLATSETWKDRNSGERKERTEWHRVVIFNEHIADVAEKYVRKGSKIYVEGQLQTRKWQDQSGQDRYSTEVVIAAFRGELTLLDSKSDNEGRQERASKPVQQRQPAAAQAARGGGDLDDEIPFGPSWQ